MSQKEDRIYVRTHAVAKVDSELEKNWHEEWTSLHHCRVSGNGEYNLFIDVTEVPDADLFRYLTFLKSHCLHLEVCGLTKDRKKVNLTKSTNFWHTFYQSGLLEKETKKQHVLWGGWWD